MNPNGLEPISDEGAYATLAQALTTTGQYKMISLPGEPYHTKYPILFPWMLSWIWRFSPSFPANISALRFLNIMFGAGFMMLLVRVFTKLCEGNRRESLLLVSLCALNPAVLSSSTTLSSEASYLFFSTLAILSVLEQEQRPWNLYWFGLSLISLVAAFYVRMPAVSLLVAVEIYLLLGRRLRESIGMALGTTALIFPWLYWCHTHNNSNRFPEFVFYNDYISDFWRFVTSHGLISLLTNNMVFIFVGIPKLLIYPFQTDLRIISQLTAWLGFAALGLLVMGFFRSYQHPKFRLIHWYVVVYVTMLLLCPYPAGERFLEPLLPFFYWFILIEIRRFVGRLTPSRCAERKRLVTILPVVSMLCIVIAWAITSLICLGFHTVEFALNKRRELATYENSFRDMNESFAWIRKETSPSDVLMANLYSLYYLHTGRKTTPLFFDSSRRLTEPKFDEAPIRKYAIRYLIVSDLDFGVYVPTVVKAMRQELRRVIGANQGLHFDKKFTSQLGKYEIYRIDGTNRNH